MSESFKINGTLQHPAHYQWEPGLIRRAPWTALTSLLLVVVCTIATIAIGVVSDGKPATWFWNPNSILGFLLLSPSPYLVLHFLLEYQYHGGVLH
jgi:hypothetical protein